jgi:hypothetical protein
MIREHVHRPRHGDDFREQARASRQTRITPRCSATAVTSTRFPPVPDRPARAPQLAAFFFWSAWAASTDGDTVTYTSNWPRPLINRPTGEAVVWNGRQYRAAGGHRRHGLVACVTRKKIRSARFPPTIRSFDAHAVAARGRGKLWTVCGLVSGRSDGRDHGSLRRGGQRFLRHPGGVDPPLRRDAHLARAARPVLDRHRVAGRGPLHRAGGQRSGTEVAAGGRQRALRRASGGGGRIDGGPMAEREADAVRDDVVLLSATAATSITSGARGRSRCWSGCSSGSC